MPRSTGDDASKPLIVIHPLDPEDGPAVAAIKLAVRAAKGLQLEATAARAQFDALMKRVPPPGNVT
ncbi:MAG TPA: hypothetical protein VGP63_01295, partial [Planctomycetaceae bacterium]|nr:hypothetical protein [Planctomycetaceae bacterium]